MSALLGRTFLALAIPVPTAGLAITLMGVRVATQAAQLEAGLTQPDEAKWDISSVTHQPVKVPARASN
jgi:hypothetical protein